MSVVFVMALKNVIIVMVMENRDVIFVQEKVASMLRFIDNNDKQDDEISAYLLSNNSKAGTD